MYKSYRELRNVGIQKRHIALLSFLLGIAVVVGLISTSRLLPRMSSQSTASLLQTESLTAALLKIKPTVIKPTVEPAVSASAVASNDALAPQSKSVLAARLVKYEMGYCSECNYPVKSTARNCPNCGVGFYGATPIMTKKKGMTMLRVGILIVGGLLIMIVIMGTVTIATKMNRRPKVSSGTSLWTGGMGNGVPTETYSGGLYQNDARKRWGHAQVPKTISGASEAGPANLGYAQGVYAPGNQAPGAQAPGAQVPGAQAPGAQVPAGTRPPTSGRPVPRPTASPQGNGQIQPQGTGGYPTGRPVQPSGQRPSVQRPTSQLPNQGIPQGIPVEGGSGNISSNQGQPGGPISSGPVYGIPAGNPRPRRQ